MTCCTAVEQDPISTYQVFLQILCFNTTIQYCRLLKQAYRTLVLSMYYSTEVKYFKMYMYLIKTPKSI